MSTISASTTSTTAFKITTDTTGALVFQTGASPTTAMTLGSDQSVTFAGTPTYSGGTANGVAYLNGSKVLTTGTVLVFDGTNLGVGVTPSAWNSGTKAVQVPYGAVFSGSNYVYLSNNHIYGSGGDVYYANGYATTYGQTSGQHRWLTAASGTAGAAITFTQAMTLDASGNLGIGTTSPSDRFDVQFATGSGRVKMGVVANNNVKIYNTSGDISLLSSDASSDVYLDSQRNVFFKTGNTERARIDSSGNFLVNSTAVGAIDNGAPQISLASAVTSSQWTSRIVSRNTGNSTASFLGNYKGSTSVAGVFAHNAALNAWATLYVNTIDGTSANGGNVVIGDNLMVGTATTAQTLSTNHYFTLRNTSGTPWGVGPTSSYGNFYVTNGGVGVYLSNGGTSWTSYSDERVKDIIEPITDAASKVSTLRAVIGKYKTDQDGVRRPFLIAQDVQAVLPEAVNVQGEDDDTLGLQYTDVIPLLVAAIKELNTKVVALENK